MPVGFDKIEQYLSKPIVLVPPKPDIPLRLYLTIVETVAGAMLAQEIDGKEQAIYYISKKFIQYETRYSQFEKCLFDKPAETGRLSRWFVMLAEFDLKFVPQKAIKG